MSTHQLLKKYNVPAPRYTSYPTVPYWRNEAMPEALWTAHVREAFAEQPEISLYIHLPFCEKLCTYCGCNKRITRNHGVEDPYIRTLLQEWQLYLQRLPGRPRISELHLGGGTPTFFSPDNLRRLVEGLFEGADRAAHAELGFESHPNSTSDEHLQVLYDLGFRRISIGVQDFDNDILRIINRQQSYEDVERVVTRAREIGYTSVNFDLIFGLPLQTPEHIIATMENVQRLFPDRIAFYSYAHVPWIKPSQRAYSEADLPEGEEKRLLYELGREFLEHMGYHEIGMDHFALESDGLYEAMSTGALHRNFMGYTPNYTRLMIGLGASSISDTWTAFAQNEKDIDAYTARVERGELPLTRGHVLSEEDQTLRRHILNIMCRFETEWLPAEAEACPAIGTALGRMEELMLDGLVRTYPYRVQVGPEGRPFIRNICMAWDAHLWRHQPQGQLFSQAV